MRSLLIFALVILAGCGGGPPQAETGEMIFRDDFATIGGWPYEVTDDFSLNAIDMTYRIETSLTRYLWAVTAPEHDDIILDVRANQLSLDPNNGYGLMCRADRDGSGYYFLISGDGFYAILRGTPQSITPLADWTDRRNAVNTGPGINFIRAVCDGENLTLIVNEEVVAWTMDDTYTRGRVGLVGAASVAGPLDVAFSDLVGWEVER